MTGSIDLTPDGRSVLISFPYREDLVEEVRMIPGRRWDRDARVWSVPVLQLDLVVDTFQPHGFSIASAVNGLRTTDSSTPTPGPHLPFVPPPEPAPALSISALNERVRHSLRNSFPDPVWVVGEVVDFDKSVNRKHIFFSLVEKKAGENQPAARAEMALFAGTWERLRPVLKAPETGLTLRDGIEIRALVRIDLYAATGRYQLILEDIDPAFTLGKMALTREAILAELRQSGLERKNAKIPLPTPPLRVGVLTSPDSDGWNDFRRQLEASGLGFSVTCYAVRVQGEELRPTMLAGLHWFAERRTQYDVLCIVRGGGSRSDLSWFDDREVALAVATHPLKVLCGIGHQRDQSVLDLIAHSEKTPTAVGALLVDKVRSEDEAVTERTRGLAQKAEAAIAGQRRRIAQLADRLARVLERRVAIEREGLTHAARRIHRGIETALSTARARLARQTEDLRRNAGLALERAGSRIERHEARQRLLDPGRVLERGYTLVRNGAGEIVKSVTGLHTGMELDISFHDGHAHAKTTRVSEHETTE